MTLALPIFKARQLGFPNLMVIGPMGAGKSAGAQFLEDEFGYTRVPIAGAHLGGIRDVAVRIWGEEARNDREKLNALGFVDDAFPGTWLRNWEAYVEDEQPFPIVVDDVRRDLEYDALRARGFVCVRVIANEQDRVDRLKLIGKWQNAAQLTGKWEQWWPTAKADYDLVNDGSKFDYFEDLVKVLNRERKRR